jgi:hypothetical protein
LQHFDTNNDIKNSNTKEELAKYISEAINKIVKCNTQYYTALEGAIQLRLLAPTFNLIPHRANNAANNQKQRELRKQYYKNKKWNSLMNLIEYEQTKRNNKTNKRNTNTINQHNQKQYHSIINTINDDIQQSNDEKKTNNQQSGNNKQDTINEINKQMQTEYIELLQSKMLINHGNHIINTNLLSQQADNIKYQTNETKEMIKNRIKRCISNAKRVI